jgi:hypothetical protein
MSPKAWLDILLFYERITFSYEYFLPYTECKTISEQSTQLIPKFISLHPWVAGRDHPGH